MIHASDSMSRTDLLVLGRVIDAGERRKFSLGALGVGRARCLGQPKAAGGAPVGRALAIGPSERRRGEWGRAPKLAVMAVCLLCLGAGATGVRCAVGARHLAGLREHARLAQRVQRAESEVHELRQANQVLLSWKAGLAAEQVRLAMQMQEAARGPRLAAGAGRPARPAHGVQLARGAAHRARAPRGAQGVRAPVTRPAQVAGRAGRGAQIAVGTPHQVGGGTRAQGALGPRQRAPAGRPGPLLAQAPLRRAAARG
jgi:hypothetical protein